MQGDFYKGEDLGASYSKTNTAFRIWAPTADGVSVCLYERGDGACLMDETPMKRDVQGTWFLKKSGDLDKIYYTYKITRNGKVIETQDPYSVATGVNGERSMVLDLKETDPKGFAEDKGPQVKSKTDMVICEISVADITGDASSNVKNRGKFLGLTEAGTKNDKGQATGLDYLKQLGITHVQIMPAFDFASIDESHPEIVQYNWGYDPVNYNVPEGSFSTDAFRGEVRIREMKEMVAALHKAGIGVIMDVVYNHMFDAKQSCFEKAEPDYFFRKKNGKYSDASACGNEVASEHPMVRKFIVDSVCYWAKEYHMDGFRFDLMGVLDTETMQELSAQLKEINPSIALYGEGWTGGASALPEYRRAMKKNARMFENIGMFSDDIRDNIRGHVFYEEACGFANGGQNLENAIRYSVAGAVWHPQVDYAAYSYTQGGPWAAKPENAISYVSCHDNLTLWDKLAVSRPDCSVEERYAMNRLAAAIVFTSQGVPFFLNGEEFARTKPIPGTNKVSENSYNLTLEINGIRYEWTKEQEALQEYYKGLIAFRKEHEGLRLSTAKQIREDIRFVENLPANVVAFTVRTEKETLFVVYNANPKAVEIELPEGKKWKVYVDAEHAGNTCIGNVSHTAAVSPLSCMVCSTN